MAEVKNTHRTVISNLVVPSADLDWRRD